MNTKIDISTLWEHIPEFHLLDVRTPAEFEKGHIPSASSLPLFTNTERAVVGTIYKETSPEEAMKKGLEFVGPKMAAFVKEAEAFAPNKKLVLYCWRGGKRSSSMAWLLNMAGFEAKVINGGYKAYRKYVRKYFEQSANYIVLGGRTGCGKTKLIEQLKDKGEQVIDLESLAAHKGSAFGALGESKQPSVEAFENQLHFDLTQFDLKKPIWIENESRSIGSIYIPAEFWKRMKEAPLINLEVPFDWRVQNLVDQYADYPIVELRNSFDRIKKRLGGLNHKLALEALDKNDFHTAAGLALRYYDKSYQYMLEKNRTPYIHHFDVKHKDFGVVAQELINFSTENIAKLN